MLCKYFLCLEVSHHLQSLQTMTQCRLQQNNFNWLFGKFYPLVSFPSFADWRWCVCIYSLAVFKSSCVWTGWMSGSSSKAPEADLWVLSEQQLSKASSRKGKNYRIVCVGRDFLSSSSPINAAASVPCALCLWTTVIHPWDFPAGGAWCKKWNLKI